MTLRVALLGCGGIAGRHAGAVAALPERMSLVGCCGRDQPRTDAFAAQHGGVAFVDLARMIGEVAPDLIIATLPPFVRGGEIEHIADRGIHLLVEKPIALDMGAAESMVAAVEATGVTAAIGFMYRHGDAVKRWKASDTGTVGMYAGSYHCNALHAPWWREQAKSGGQMLEQVIHQIDLVRHLVGEPSTVYARRANLFHRNMPGYDVEDISAILFGWDDGRIATLDASNIATPGEWHKAWAVYAERLTGRFTSWNDAVLTPTQAGAAAETIAGPSDPFIAQLADLANAIRDRRPPLVPLREGSASLRLALAARQSADERTEICLADPA
ncbi:Gfo/Idh/MocA family oxidoreductase [Sphingomonas sp. BIUV-7]|uniref:Gfo/Idh/MocA family oxidoreductase n=1 Tax=Sphingomonas natans TaxID=3063330 RepID=A0ABT8Y8G5_9SPHN|nr:Gfo/Idh/MocA family oxidoreductase [Sphingomonas sp. BIUV-7]MDO6414267.1 Gfo/Idh/MocA family oxidoreductase [Sphingomonas sp. BIUV-7]